MRNVALALRSLTVLTSFGAALSAAPQQKPQFRGSAVLVTVDAYPQRDGKVVEGLTAADFELLEDNKPQTIDEIEFIRVEPNTPEASRRDPNNQREMLEEAADPRNRVFVTYLDTPHVTVEGSHAIRQPLVETLNRLMGPTDLFGVMTPNIDPRFITFQRRLLGIEEQLSKYWPWGQRERLTRDPANPIEDLLHSCFEAYPYPSHQNVQEFKPWIVDERGEKRYLYDVLIDRDREDRTLTSLERLMDRLAGMREARTVVLIVTDGWLLYEPNQGLANEAGRWPSEPPRVGRDPLSGSVTTTRPVTLNQRDRAVCNKELLRIALLDNPMRFRELITRANRANISFYPVGPGGLGVYDVSPTTRPQPIGTTPMPMERNLDRRKDRISNSRTIAENTDGIAIVDTNDLRAGLKRVSDDMSAYYLLKYYSTNTQNDGKYRAIKLKTKATDIKLRSRRGYFAPLGDSSTLKTGGSSGSSLGAPGLQPRGGDDLMAGVASALEVLSRLSPSAELFARTVLDGSDLWVAVEMPSSKLSIPEWTKGAEVQVTIADAAGKTATAAGQITAGTRGVLLKVPLAPLGGAAPARVTARISAGGASLDGGMDIRATAESDLGAPLLFRGTPAASSPLRPVADLQYRRTERVRLEWVLPDGLANRSARLIGRNGLPLPVPVNLTERDVEGRLRLAADVNLAPLAAGDYLVEVTGDRNGKTFRSLTAIRVLQ